MGKTSITIVYDGQCPICNFYWMRVNLVNAFDEVNLIDARDNPPILDLLAKNNIDIDHDIAIKIGDQLYAGADAMVQISLMAGQSTLFNRLNYWVFSSKTRAKILYPPLRFLRLLLLKILGIRKIKP